MYEALLKATPEYQKIAESLRTPGPAALFGLPPAGRALLYAALQKDLGRLVCIVTPGEAEATHFADDLKALGLTAAVFPPRDFMLRPVEGAGREYEYRRLSVLGALAGTQTAFSRPPASAPSTDSRRYSYSRPAPSTGRSMKSRGGNTAAERPSVLRSSAKWVASASPGVTMQRTRPVSFWREA